jgi:hypothetical protein
MADPRASERAIPVSAKKARLVDLYSKGHGLQEACDIMGISFKSYEYYRKTDEAFKERIDRIREFRNGGKAAVRKAVPRFEEFSEKYLGAKIFPHQQQWIDLLEGGEPTNVHPAQIYSKGFSPQHLVINTPPEHAKSTTITINYVTWRIVQNPQIKILIVSSNATMANKFLRAVKMRLDSTRAFGELKKDFAPVEGFDGGNATWRNDMIYVNNQDDEDDPGEKDATVQALGIGKKIYGVRADLIILDDVVDKSNAHDFENQIDWIQNILQSRIDSDDGKLLLVGTRLATQDLYSEVLKPEYYEGEECPWTYLSQPAVLNMPSMDPETWTTLWPYSNQRLRGRAGELQVANEDGLFAKWNGPKLAVKRRSMSERNWSMVYQQEQVSADAIFKPAAINGCSSSRRPGPLLASPLRPSGMLGLTVIGGLDPAAAGHTAAVVIGLDRRTGKRYLLDVFNQASLNYNQIITVIKEWTVLYGIQEWRVEKNNVQAWIPQDQTLRDFLHSRGTSIQPHFTDGNKWDVDFGVASMATLFDGYEDGHALIDLPSPRDSAGVQALRTQLISWAPATKGKTDLVMAMWFAEIRCRELMNETNLMTHLGGFDKYRSAMQQEQMVTIDIEDYVARNAVPNLGFL